MRVVAVLRDESALAGAHDIEIRDGLAYVAGKGFTLRARPVGGGGVFPYQPVEVFVFMAHWWGR